MIPNFLVIGAQKAGTTSLLNYLAFHPDIFVADEKEVSPLYGDEEYNQRFKKYPYEKYFEAWCGQKYAGNGPANLLYFAERTAGRIHDYNPATKLIAILRNPIDRAYSAYWYMVRTGFEKSSFESALQREARIIKHGNFLQRGNLTYISHGYYYEQLKHFFKQFNREQLLILVFDDLKADVKGVLKKIYFFLSIEEHYPEDVMGKKYNVGSKPRVQFISDVIYGDSALKRVYQKIFSESLRRQLRTRVVKKIRDRNLVPYDYPPMPADTRAYLRKIFEKPNQKLASLLDTELPDWT